MNLEELAKKRVKRKKKFYKDLGDYAMVSAILLVINLLTSRFFLWSLIPITVFVILIIQDFVKIYGNWPKDKEWEQKAYEKELRRLKTNNSSEESEYLELPQKTIVKEKPMNWDEKDLL